MENSLPNLKYLCACKHSENESRTARWNGICIGCCSFCKAHCPTRTCEGRTREDLCCWRRTLLEWMLGRIDENAHQESYQRRRVEYYLRQGFKEGDGTWEGELIKKLRKRFGKDFGCVE